MIGNGSKIFIFLFLLFHILAARSQELPVRVEQQLEAMAESGENDAEDDGWLQDLDQFRRDRININMATASELRQLQLLTELQINSLLTYRRLLGEFVSLYELQALPGWEPSLIRKLIPLLTLQSSLSTTGQLKRRFNNGEYSFISRISQVLERSDGFKDAGIGKKYTGSPQHLLFRLKYNYKNLLQWGISGDKDAGESFFKGRQKSGFDHYSLHLFIRKLSFIKAIAIGDFTVNMGQGLIQWQSMAFKKSAEPINIKRQSEVLRPYSSSGEFYFNRGIGISLGRKSFSFTGFFSFRELSTNLERDSVTGKVYITSFQTSGYHRSREENADRNNTNQLSFGSNLSFERKNLRASWNFVGYGLSFPIRKRDDAYNLYAISSKNWFNASTDYGYTWRNVHCFGEYAIDKLYNWAFLAGIMISADRKVDLSFLYRKISAAYQSFNGNAFTEATLPSNEKGTYAGISIRPFSGFRIDGYADIFSFPWLRYRVDAPSVGKDILLQFNFTPDKQTEIYLRYRSGSKGQNEVGENINTVIYVPRQSLRLHISRKIDATCTLRQRVEVTSFDSRGRRAQQGFLCFADLLIHPPLKPYSSIIRLQYFETSGYDSRIYAFENDVLYSFSIPSYSGMGFRYYFLVSYDLTRKFSLWCRYAQTIFPELAELSEGPDRIAGNRKTELKLQLRYIF